MKEKIQIKSLVLGVVLGAALVLSIAAAIPVNPSYNSNAWEYRFFDQRKIVEQGKQPGNASDNLEPLLNRLTTEGWEVVNYADTDHGVSVLLKRRSRGV
jgi:hypothetical protein